MIERLESMLANGQDTTLLRFTLGKNYIEIDDIERAVTHLQRCVELDPTYSAAWKLLGKARLARGDVIGARRAWEEGIRMAAARGNKQVEKEMVVFLRRLDKS
jgi:Flp pilus assembly protein TadD